METYRNIFVQFCNKFLIIPLVVLHLGEILCKDYIFEEPFRSFNSINFEKYASENEIEFFQFENEESFLERFGDIPDIANSFINVTKSFPNAEVPGDMGFPVTIDNPTKEIAAEIKEGYETYGYNKYVSDMIPIHRRLPEQRHDGCFATGRYLKTLSPTSIIISFYNEALSVLLRTVHSVLDRSPNHLIADIILIDDFSDHDELGRPLEDAIKGLKKVKLVRLPQREGLVRARLMGFDLARGPILTFLDSHVEVAPEWLEPLLDRITRSWTTVAIPVFNTIDPKTFACNFTDKPNSVGAFKWDLLFTFLELPEEYQENVDGPMDPIPSPTMSGGFFSIHKDFFEHLGKYDPKFEIWGAENLEMSFKIWMCGGRLELIPCSNVAHLERTKSVYSRDKLAKNNARLALTWMDEYAEYYLNRIPAENRDPGDIRSRLELRKKLNCSSFDWYMKTMLPNIFVPKEALASGEVKNLDPTGKFCLDAHVHKNVSKKSPSLYWECHGMAGNQYWYYTSTGEIRHDEMCLDYFGKDIALTNCHRQKGNQAWEYHADTGVIVHERTGMCLTMNQKLYRVVAATCEGTRNQKWKFQDDKVFEALKDFSFKSQG